jgi:non-reducing end alpha-L-arabinofuranosidase
MWRRLQRLGFGAWLVALASVMLLGACGPTDVAPEPPPEAADDGGLFAPGTDAGPGGRDGGGVRADGAASDAGRLAAEGGSATGITGPCDVYAAGNTPCVAAHSTVRALFGAYSGPLYRVRRQSDKTTLDIGVLNPGGFANADAQDPFCNGTSCVITVVYDQSGRGNHLEYQGEGSSVGGKDDPAVATTESLTLSGHRVYSLFIKPGNSYWRDGSKTGIPTGAAPEGMYMVTSGTHVNGGCCFDYGNSETTRKADAAGAMDAIYFGTSCWFGGCSGSGPWVQADLEWGLYPGGSQSWNKNQRAFTNQYVTATLKNDGSKAFAIRGGDAQSGGLTTLWDGALPPGYSPMKKQGAIVLGSGGDCCAAGRNLSEGTFYEGAIVTGYPSGATEDLLQRNIIAAGYGD